MNNEWLLKTLYDAGIILIDCDHKTPPAQEEGIPYIGIPQMKNGHIKFELNPRLITEEDYVKWTTKAKPKLNDVILSRRCNPGVIAHVPNDVKFALGQNLVLLRSVGDDVDPSFLRWLTSGRKWWAQVNKFLNVGAVFDSLRCRDIPKFEVNLPPLPEQKAIAHILGTLDDKIELNRQMNETLEAMAQALFKSWFVDFDPVLDKALAAGNPIPDALQVKADKRKAVHKSGQHKPLPKDIQDLFPAAFEYNDELEKWIPEGWEIENFRDLASLNPESWTIKTMPDSINYIDLSNTNEGKIESVAYYEKEDAPSRAKRIVRPNDIIIGTVRPGNKSYAYIQKDNMTASTGFAVIRAEKDNAAPFLYFALTNSKTIEHFAHIADGGAYPAIRPDVVIDYRSVIPSFDCIEEFGRLVSQKIKKIGSNNETEITLKGQRDLLLSQLISGKTRLPKSFVKKFETNTAAAS